MALTKILIMWKVVISLQTRKWISWQLCLPTRCKSDTVWSILTSVWHTRNNNNDAQYWCAKRCCPLARYYKTCTIRCPVCRPGRTVSLWASRRDPIENHSFRTRNWTRPTRTTILNLVRTRACPVSVFSPLRNRTGCSRTIGVYVLER